MASQQNNIIDVWDRVSETYSADAVVQPDYQAQIHIMLRSIGNPSGNAMCEVGCGLGVISVALSHMGAKISLVDKSPKALDFAHKNFEKEEIKTEFHLQDATDMQFPDGN
jgi:ubiquinone/menaquinone biosynthesis C-methylase UbiE